MASVGVVQVRCPECDVAVPITMLLKPSTHEGDMLIVDIESDLTDVMAHVWTHEAVDEAE